MRYYQLYLITNLVNNKKYIGQTNQQKGYRTRFKEHIYESIHSENPISVLHKAIKKYGSENFSVKLLLHNIPDTSIDFYESLWIDKLDTYYRNNKGYNMTYGGRGTNGYIFTDEVRKKMGNGVKMYWESLDEDEYKRLCKIRSDNMKGKEKSLSHRQKLSEWASTRTGDKNSFYGKHHSDESKKAIGESNSKCIGMYDIENDILLKEFSSIKCATDWLIANNLTTNKNASSRISKICNGIDKSAYGYVWKFL